MPDNEYRWKYITESFVCDLDAWKSEVGQAGVEVHVTLSLSEE